jgi:hypothetical protein
MADVAQRYDVIGVRGVLGFFFMALEQMTGQLWIDKICNTFESNQDTETYAGLGAVPQMREWIGSKQAKEFTEMSVKISNKDFEATIRFKNKDLRRDKTNQIMARIGELAQRCLSHDALLLSAIINGGTSTSITFPNGTTVTVSAYDGQALFSTSHLIGTTALNNDLTFSLTTAATILGTAVGAGTTTNPSPAAFALAIQAALSQLYGFQDDQLQPLNEFAREFIVMVPPSLSGPANAAVKGQFLALGYNNPLLDIESPSMKDLKFTVVTNPRLTSFTTQFVLFRTDGMGFRPLIRQVEALEPMPNMAYGEEDSAPVGYGLQMKVLAQGSDHEFFENEQLYSVEKSGMVGIGRFDQCVYQSFVS